MQPQYQEEKPLCTFFLFVNSGSGGGLGNQIVSQEIEKIQFKIPIKNEKDIHRADVYFINMRKTRQKGFKKLKELNEKKQKTIAVVCGGDGTVMWVVGQYSKFGINPMDTPIAIIPLGTGNDFSRALGWGPEKTMLLQYNYRSLKKLIRKWLHAKQEKFDLWDVSAQIFPNGKFEKVQNGENKLVEGSKISKTFCNYFSFGIDGKIGYSFDMHRASSRLGNLAVYGTMGLVKGMTKTKTIDELVEKMEIDPEGEQERKMQSEKSLIFKSMKATESVTEEKKEEKQNLIKQGYQNILALNIDSFSGGVNGIWEKGKEMFDEKSKQKQKKHTKPSFSDGKLQIVSFGSGFAMACERTFGGGYAKRITQGNGPYIFNFRRFQKQQKHRTYLQIDGEFIRFTHPKNIILKHSKMVPDGKIKILQNDPNFVPFVEKN